MKKISALAFAALICLSCQESISSITDRVIDVAVQQCKLMDAQLDDSSTPRTYTPQGIFVEASLNWWCSGFYPGTMWLLYGYTGDEQLKDLALKNTAKLADVKAYGSGHDLGFQYWCSYGNGWLRTGDEALLPVIQEAASDLAARFNPTVGCIRSWGNIDETANFKVIIDNMMNLELLMEASKLFDCDSLKEIALSHARTTIANHYRDNYTCYHVLDYDQTTGFPAKKMTAQGYADESSWSRGQAWGLYGFTMMYRESGCEEFLAQAEKVASTLIPMLPEDGIPYWDYDCPAIPYTYRDASAGAIMCSALIELSTLTKDRALAKKCLATARRQIRTFASKEYLAKPGTNGCFLLRHSVGNLHGDQKNRILEVDAPLTYADYYYIEALLRYRAL